MSILVWNCRGLGNPRPVRILKKLVKDKCPNLVFLVETKTEKQRLQSVRRSLSLDGCFAVDSMGLSGGIALLWKEEWEVTIINYTLWHISAVVKEEDNGQTWQFTGFYGHPETAKRKGSWQLLEMLKPPTPMAWQCAGDFNEILHQKEKQGAVSRPYKQIEDFKKVVEICGLQDLHSLGQSFTWSNNRRGRDFTKERIDRAMVNKEWSELFSSATCTALAAIKSDHSPLCISKHKEGNGKRKRKVCFRYEVAWDLKEECKVIVEKAWKADRMNGGGVNLVRLKLELCQRGLVQWNQKERMQTQKDINQKLKKISHLQETGSGEHIAAMKHL
ncbi:uncharacterized protein LOC122276974 [Carya illinoinensis]|uniref:uncharacterized protein LOC122276974 n=1 Tax=Carya illinoinensis TaxID=32201 RepID=UPI001C72108F|nr:uncharacterized protein LOC122276974 [Carya illinoinensis]